MVLCSRCKKRPAVIFLSHPNGSQDVDSNNNTALCLQCAEETGVLPKEMIEKQFGISAEQIDAMMEQMPDIMEQMEDSGIDFSNIASFPMMSADEKEDDQQEGTEKTEEQVKKGKKSKPKDKKKSFLEMYCTNLTANAAEGKIDRIIGRDREIYRAVQILSRRTKNNPCFIGEPGVGKTAIAEGIALRISSGDVPFRLMNKQLYLLDLTALVAGTQFRGQFESRVKGLIDEVKETGNIILFIDEVHNLVGTGEAEGSMNAANILKPALSRGEVQVIGATTFTEYRKYIEKDAALERRFQPIPVEEPSISDADEMVKGIKQYYEDFHRVHVSDEIVKKAVALSEKYITDRFLPDKAIDLLDEACSHASIQSVAITEYEKASKKIDDLNTRMEEMEGDESPDYEKIATVRAEILVAQSERDGLKQAASCVRVTEDDLARVVELWTGIPASRIKQSEYGRLSSLKANILEKIKGQDTAVDAVVNAIKRTRAGLSKRGRPASFIFVGPTGVGKTELAKVLAGELFDSVEPLVRLDMSEYMEKHAVSKIVGSPPGYVGYDEAGQLTEKIRRKPYSIVLFDEIEKAHPDVMNILLQILDEGKITDSHGRRVNFEHTVIIMTSNAGNDKTGMPLGFNKTQQEMSSQKVKEALSSFLRPEFIARVDEIVVFDPLSDQTLKDITGLMMDEYRDPLLDKGIVFTYTPAVLGYIVEKASGQKSAARDLRHTIRREIEDPVASLLIDSGEDTPKIIHVDVVDGKIKIEQ